jgi:hypothetical protein
LTAVTFDLFSTLGQRGLTSAEIGKKLDLHPRGVADFLDALVAMKFLDREGDGADARYFNTPATALYLDRNSRATSAESRRCSMRGCSGTGMICRKRCARANRKTKPSTAAKTYSMTCMPTPEKLECFLDGMTGLSRINFEALADKFDFSRYRSLCDVGGATGLLRIEVAKKHPHIECITLDLSPVEPVAKKHITAAGWLTESALRRAISFRICCRRPTWSRWE